MAEATDSDRSKRFEAVTFLAASVDAAANRLGDRLSLLETRIGITSTAFIVGLVILLLASVYVAPAVRCQLMGCGYADLASDPFPTHGDNPVAFRILTPLVSYGLGLHGNGILITNMMFAYALLVLLYWQLRKDDYSPKYTSLCTLAFGLSLPTLITVHYGGYTDSLTYLLLAISYFYRHRAWVLWLAFGLSLFNREAVGFVVPWLLYLRWMNRKSNKAFWREALLALLVTFGAYGAFRLWTAERSHVLLSTAYYLRPLSHNPLFFWQSTFGFQWYGLFSVFKLLWILPCITLLHAWRFQERETVTSLLLLMTCVYIQLFFAWDTSRMLSLGFPCMFIAWATLIPKNVAHVRKWLAALIAVNLLIPNLYTTGHVLELMHGTLYTVARYIVDLS